MCGRTSCTVTDDELALISQARREQWINRERFRRSFNSGPGSFMPVVVRRTPTALGDTPQAPPGAFEMAQAPTGSTAQCKFTVHFMQWGLVPSFSRSSEQPDFFLMFNARAESLSEKPSFRRLIPTSRCVAVVDGYFEWMKEGNRKQPYFIQLLGSRPLCLAALHDTWNSPEGKSLNTFTIITVRASERLQWMHDRMPAILPNQSAIDTWLGRSKDGGDATCRSATAAAASASLQLLQPYNEEDLVWHAVTPRVGKRGFNGPDCIKEVKLQSLTKWFGKKVVHHPDIVDKAADGAAAAAAAADGNAAGVGRATHAAETATDAAAGASPRLSDCLSLSLGSASEHRREGREAEGGAEWGTGVESGGDVQGLREQPLGVVGPSSGEEASSVSRREESDREESEAQMDHMRAATSTPEPGVSSTSQRSLRTEEGVHHTGGGDAHRGLKGREGIGPIEDSVGEPGREAEESGAGGGDQGRKGHVAGTGSQGAGAGLCLTKAQEVKVEVEGAEKKVEVEIGGKSMEEEEEAVHEGNSAPDSVGGKLPLSPRASSPLSSLSVEDNRNKRKAELISCPLPPSPPPPASPQSAKAAELGSVGQRKRVRGATAAVRGRGRSGRVGGGGGSSQRSIMQFFKRP